MPNLRRVGAEAEDLAARYLLEQGYTVVTRRFKARGGEIDIVALDGDVLVFVEVKMRATPGLNPEDFVGPHKVRLFAQAAREYMLKTGRQDAVARFDLIGVTPEGIRHHLDAFREASGGR